jgi:hypothetical protein
MSGDVRPVAHPFRVPRRLLGPAVGLALLVVAISPGGTRAAADKPISLAGRWALDRDHSEMPAEIGFDIAVEGVGQSPENAAAGGGRTRAGRTGSAGPIAIAHEGEQTLKILNDVTDEAKHPWPIVVITQTADLVTLSDGDTQSRPFHPGKDDEQRLVDGGIGTRSKWEKGTFIVDYQIEKDRIVRYTYARTSETGPLEVTVSFLDHGHGSHFKRVYQR